MTAPLKAYDIEMRMRPVDRANADNHGWCFGLPPGLSTQQWPLDPASGYPLMHGFTLLLPEDYRVHGPEIVALSFFAIAPEQNDGGPLIIPELADAVDAKGAMPTDPELLPFWNTGLARHPRLFRMTDSLDYSYAVILLTQAEFDGPLCSPPLPLKSKYLEGRQPPKWLEIGSASAFLAYQHGTQSTKAAQEHWFAQQLGQIPEETYAYNCALHWTQRANDPNAGKAPRPEWATEQTGYVPYFYWLDGKVDPETYRIHDWAKDHGVNHIGGTMRPTQNIPAISPYYVEFDEYLGGFNFAGSSAQLDFRDMAFHWAFG